MTHCETDTRSFEEVFSPLAHHLFPDGCPKDEVESSISSISVSKCWPRRCDRSIVSLKDAVQSIANIHRYSQRNGCYPHELLQLCIVACATLTSEETPLLQSRVLEGLRSASVSHSELIDGTSYYFIRILQCMVPCGSCKDPECMPPEILRKLLSVASSNKCDTDGKCAVVRFLVRTQGNRQWKGKIDLPRHTYINISLNFFSFFPYIPSLFYTPTFFAYRR
jgi:hypothetical protein